MVTLCYGRGCTIFAYAPFHLAEMDWSFGESRSSIQLIRLRRNEIQSIINLEGEMRSLRVILLEPVE